MIYYLKVNRDEPYTYNNLRQWIQAIDCSDNYYIYILCDREIIKEKILAKVQLPEKKYEFLKSGISNDVNETVKWIADEPWQKAAIAHLTTFQHADQNGYQEFWNIDADDTLLCLSAKRTAECMRIIERRAAEDQIHLFSLDMWATRDNGIWTFGITYCNNTIDWLSVILKHCRDEAYASVAKLDYFTFNIDCFMAYLRTIQKAGWEKTAYRIESYYFENLRFVHYSNDFMRRPLSSGFWHYKDQQIISPLLSSFFNREDLGCQSINGEVMKLDAHITDQEAADFLRMYGNDDGAFWYFDHALEHDPVAEILSYGNLRFNGDSKRKGCD